MNITVNFAHTREGFLWSQPMPHVPRVGDAVRLTNPRKNSERRFVVEAVEFVCLELSEYAGFQEQNATIVNVFVNDRDACKVSIAPVLLRIRERAEKIETHFVGGGMRQPHTAKGAIKDFVAIVDEELAKVSSSE